MNYVTVVNDEGQYSVWPADEALPLGWHATGHVDTREACLRHIEQVWTDQAPASVRRRLEMR
jgi:MbtH protein